MSYKDVTAFVRANPVFFISTIDGDQPRVRAFLSVFFDDDLIYFTTGMGKSVWKQLERNPKVELCYCAPDFGKMLRIAATIEVVDDRARKQQLIDERDYLKGLKADDPQFKLLRIPHGKARFWTIENNMKEDRIEIIEF